MGSLAILAFWNLVRLIQLGVLQCIFNVEGRKAARKEWTKGGKEGGRGHKICLNHQEEVKLSLFTHLIGIKPQKSVRTNKWVQQICRIQD